MNLLEEIEKLNKEELQNIVLHCIGVYSKMWGKKLPFVYCPLCSERIKEPKPVKHWVPCLHETVDKIDEEHCYCSDCGEEFHMEE